MLQRPAQPQHTPQTYAHPTASHPLPTHTMASPADPLQVMRRQPAGRQVLTHMHWLQTRVDVTLHLRHSPANHDLRPTLATQTRPLSSCRACKRDPICRAERTIHTTAVLGCNHAPDTSRGCSSQHRTRVKVTPLLTTGSYILSPTQQLRPESMRVTTRSVRRMCFGPTHACIQAHTTC